MKTRQAFLAAAISVTAALPILAQPQSDSQQRWGEVQRNADQLTATISKTMTSRQVSDRLEEAAVLQQQIRGWLSDNGLRVIKEPVGQIKGNFSDYFEGWGLFGGGGGSASASFKGEFYETAANKEGEMFAVIIRDPYTEAFMTDVGAAAQDKQYPLECRSALETLTNDLQKAHPYSFLDEARSTQWKQFNDKIRRLRAILTQLKPAIVKEKNASNTAIFLNLETWAIHSQINIEYLKVSNYTLTKYHEGKKSWSDLKSYVSFYDCDEGDCRQLIWHPLLASSIRTDDGIYDPKSFIWGVQGPNGCSASDVPLSHYFNLNRNSSLNIMN